MTADQPLFRSWLRATSVGWLLGVPLIVVLALLGEAVGIGGQQWLVGAGMGAGIGLMQGRAIRPLLGRAAPWFWSSAGGLALPFLVTDLSKLTPWSLPYSLYVVVAIGGVIVGGWQALLLRRAASRAGWWVPASLVGWSLAALVAALPDRLLTAQAIRGVPALLLYLGIVATGGVVLGAVSGATLAWLVGGAREG